MTLRKCPCRCGTDVAVGQISCPQSWRSLPPELRRRIWREYRQEAGSRAHAEAVQEAVGLIRPV